MRIANSSYWCQVMTLRMKWWVNYDSASHLLEHAAMCTVVHIQWNACHRQIWDNMEHKSALEHWGNLGYRGIFGCKNILIHRRNLRKCA